MFRIVALLFTTIFTVGCGPAADPDVFNSRVIDAIDYSGTETVVNDWRLRAYKNEQGLNILVVTGLVRHETEYSALKNHDNTVNPALKDFTWTEGWMATVTSHNETPDLFDDVCDWLEDEADWDEVDEPPLRWEDGWIQAILKGENPYQRNKEIHEVWVVDSLIEMTGVERDKIFFPQLGCMMAAPPVAIMFYPEHYETATGTLRLQVYDTLNRRFRDGGTRNIETEIERRKVHGFWGNLIGHCSFGMFNLPPRMTFFWIPMYDTDSTDILADIIDQMEDDDEFEEGVEDLVNSAGQTRPDTLPATLRVRAGKGYIDSSRVLTLPITIKNLGKGEAWNVRVMISTSDEEIAKVAPEKIDLGDIGPGKSVDTKIRFRLPRNLRGNVIVLTLQAKDESPQKFKKTQVRIPLR